jgi:hypothetical protein
MTRIDATQTNFTNQSIPNRATTLSFPCNIYFLLLSTPEIESNPPRYYILLAGKFHFGPK